MATDIHKCCASCVKRKNSSFSCSDDDLKSSDRRGQPQCTRIKKDNHEDVDLDSGLSGSDVDSNQRTIQLRHHASSLGGWTSSLYPNVMCVIDMDTSHLRLARRCPSFLAWKRARRCGMAVQRVAQHWHSPCVVPCCYIEKRPRYARAHEEDGSHC